MERIDALGPFDPIDRFVGAANVEQQIRAADQDVRVAGVERDCLIVPGKSLLDLAGFGVDAGADIVRFGIIGSEQDGLVGVFGGALQRLVTVMLLLVPAENRVEAIGPGQPDIAELGSRIRFDRLEAQLPQ